MLKVISQESFAAKYKVRLALVRTPPAGVLKGDKTCRFLPSRLGHHLIR